MKFTVETEAFIRLLGILAEHRPRRRKSCGPACLTARGGRVSVEYQEKIAEIEAQVWEGGDCRVSAHRLLSAVKSCREQIDLAVETRRQSLHVGAFVIPVVSTESTPRFPRPSQVFVSPRTAFFDLQLTPERHLVGTGC